MDFSFTPEQEQLREAIRRYLGQQYSFAARKAIIHGAGTSATAWRGLAEPGLLGVPVPAAHGGFGGSGGYRLVVMEELGRGLEMFMETEQARSLALLAAVKVDGDNAAERARAVRAAKVRVGRAAKLVGQTAIQLHGGMGMTDEMPVGHYFKPLTMIGATLGDTDHHLAAFATLAVAA